MILTNTKSHIFGIYYVNDTYFELWNILLHCTPTFLKKEYVLYQEMFACIYYFTVIVSPQHINIYYNITSDRHPGFHCLWKSETDCPFPLSSLKLRRFQNPSILQKISLNIKILQSNCIWVYHSQKSKLPICEVFGNTLS